MKTLLGMWFPQKVPPGRHSHPRPPADRHLGARASGCTERWAASSDHSKAGGQAPEARALLRRMSQPSGQEGPGPTPFPGLHSEWAPRRAPLAGSIPRAKRAARGGPLLISGALFGRSHRGHGGRLTHRLVAEGCCPCAAASVCPRWGPR